MSDQYKPQVGVSFQVRLHLLLLLLLPLSLHISVRKKRNGGKGKEEAIHEASSSSHPLFCVFPPSLRVLLADPFKAQKVKRKRAKQQQGWRRPTD